MTTAKPLIIGHRGSSSHAPENTLDAIGMAFRNYRADMVEIDVRLTKDNVPVLLHDAQVDRTTDGSGYVSDFTLQELQTLDAGYHFDPKLTGDYPKRGQDIRIPTLEDALRDFPARSFAIELKVKAVPLIHQVIELLKNHEAEKRAIVGSKYDIVARELAANYPRFRRFCSQKEILRLYLDFFIGKQNSDEIPLTVVSIPVQTIGFRLDQEAWIHYLHQKKTQVFFWNIPDTDTMRNLLEKGADGLVVDDLEEINNLLNRDS